VDEDKNTAIPIAFIAIVNAQARLQFGKARCAAAIFGFHFCGIGIWRISPDKDCGDRGHEHNNEPFDKTFHFFPQSDAGLHARPAMRKPPRALSLADTVKFA
jgi:hypothetical protein